MERLSIPATFGRRAFFGGSVSVAAAGARAVDVADPSDAEAALRKPKAPLFKISLAEWSFHRLLKAGELHNLDFAKTAASLGFDAIEYVNGFFKDKAKDKTYLAELKRRAVSEGVWSALVMIDGEGNLGDTDAATRRRAIESHKPWLDAAAFLGCHAIRVNALSDAKDDDQGHAEAMRLVADSLRALGEAGEAAGIDVLVENHGGRSSNGAWLAGVMKAAAHPRVGTLPDFGNFQVSEGITYDAYQGVEELMPFARAVSAKSNDFDKRGRETQIDYLRMMKLVLAAGYRGYVGVEYGGTRLPPVEGVVATKKLLERVRAQLA